MNDLSGSEDVLYKNVSDDLKFFRYDDNTDTENAGKEGEYNFMVCNNEVNQYKQAFYCFICTLKVTILRHNQNTLLWNFIKKIQEKF